MAATIASLGSAFTTTAGNKTVTATPTVGDLIVVIAVASGVATSAVTDNQSGTYTQVGTTRTGFSTTGNLQIFVRDSLVSSAVSTIYTAAQASSTGGGLLVFRVTGMTLTGAAAVRSSGGQSTGTAGTTPAPVLSLTPLSSNPIITAIASANTVAGSVLVERTGYTEDFDNVYSTPATAMEVNHLASGETSATLTQGGTSTTAFASQSIELAYVVAPTVTTSAASSILGVSATGNGNVTSAGNGTLTSRGFCWSTSANPTTADSKVVDASATTGSYSDSMTGLTPGTNYHYRAYAINEAGTSYGADTTFTTNTSPTTALNTPIDTAVGQSTTPTLNFTGTDIDGDTLEYEVQVDTVNTFDSITSTGSVVNSFLATSSNSFWGHIDNLYKIGQSFTATGSYSTNKIGMYINKNGSPVDNVYLELRSGSNTGTLLGTSNNINGAAISTTAGYVDFTFPTPISLTNGVKYYIIMSRSGGLDNTNRYGYFSGGLSAYSGGGSSTYTLSTTTWSAESGSNDASFRVYNTVTGPLLDKFSTTDAGFTAGHPFASAAAKDFTVQAGDTLANSTVYYWRVRAIDPTGSNTYGAWTTAFSFTTTAGAGGNIRTRPLSLLGVG